MRFKSFFFFFSSRRRHTRLQGDWNSDVCSSDLLLRLVGDLTAGAPPVPIPNTEVKPRWADCTARESVWESRSLPALIKAVERNLDGLFLFALSPATKSDKVFCRKPERLSWLRSRFLIALQSTHTRSLSGWAGIHRSWTFHSRPSLFCTRCRQSSIMAAFDICSRMIFRTTLRIQNSRRRTDALELVRRPSGWRRL